MQAANETVTVHVPGTGSTDYVVAVAATDSDPLLLLDSSFTPGEDGKKAVVVAQCTEDGTNIMTEDEVAVAHLMEASRNVSDQDASE